MISMAVPHTVSHTFRNDLGKAYKTLFSSLCLRFPKDIGRSERTVTSRFGEMETLRLEFRGKLAVVCGGMRGRNVSAHGLSLDEIKSALQKYGRRGELAKGMRVLMDAESFALDETLGGGASPGLKAVRTNVMNRLLIMSVEDCLHPSIYPRVASLYRRWSTDRNGVDGMSAITGLYATIAQARKGRMPSIVKLLTKIGSPPPQPSPSPVAEYWRSVFMAPANADFQTLLRRGDVRCATLLHTVTVDTAWRIIEDVMMAHSPAAARVASTLKGLHATMVVKKHAEAVLFLYQALVIAVFRTNVEDGAWLDADAPELPQQTRETHVLDAYREHLRDRAPIVLDDYCIDMHTARGRAAGKDAIDFATEGAVVTNPDTRIVPEQMRTNFAHMYLDSKQHAAPVTTGTSPPQKRQATTEDEVACPSR